MLEYSTQEYEQVKRLVVLKWARYWRYKLQNREGTNLETEAFSYYLQGIRDGLALSRSDTKNSDRDQNRAVRGWDAFANYFAASHTNRLTSR